MPQNFDELTRVLRSNPKTWLITGVAGFIGSNLLEGLLKLDQRIVGLDNFSSGYQHNLDEVHSLVTPEQWDRFTFINGDIRDLNSCRRVCDGVDCVLHQAALGSVPRSIDDPIATNESNVSGFLNMLVAARDAKVKRFVYASSSSTYGDDPTLPKVEEKIGSPLSPYAVTKYVNEVYADVFSRVYGVECVASAILMCSAGGRTPTAPMQPSFPSGSQGSCAESRFSSMAMVKPPAISVT